MDLYILDSSDGLDISRLANGKKMPVLRNQSRSSALEKVELKESNVFLENKEDMEPSVRGCGSYSIILEGLRHSLENHSQMRKPHQEEEAWKVAAFIKWKTQRQQECLLLEEEIESRLEALKDWRENG